MLHWVTADTDADREVVEEDQLIARECPRVVRRLTRGRQGQSITHRAHCDPRRATSIWLPEPERPRASELQRIGALEARSLYDVVDRRESVPASRRLECLERFLAESADVSPADAQRRPLRIFRRRGGAFPIAIAHARW